MAPAGLLAGQELCPPSLLPAGTGQRKVLGWLGTGSLGALAAGGAARGPVPVPHRVPRGIHHGQAESPTLSAAAIEGLCVSPHKVGIDAVSPPPAVLSRAASGSYKGALLSSLRPGCQQAEGEAARCGLEHPPLLLC